MVWNIAPLQVDYDTTLYIIVPYCEFCSAVGISQRLNALLTFSSVRILYLVVEHSI